MRQLEELSFTILSTLMTGDTFVAASNITTLSARLSQMIMVAAAAQADGAKAQLRFHGRENHSSSEFMCKP
jgi:hypothetical protein